LTKLNIKLDLVANIDVPRDVILDRLTTRRTCSNTSCQEIYNIRATLGNRRQVQEMRQPDDPARRRDRGGHLQALDTYNEKTAPLIGYYEKKGLVLTVREASSDGVVNAIKKASPRRSNGPSPSLSREPPVVTRRPPFCSRGPDSEQGGREASPLFPAAARRRMLHSARIPINDPCLSILPQEDPACRRLGHHADGAVPPPAAFYGRPVTLVENGRDALVKLTQEPFDLLLTDINMPEMNGIELVRHCGQALRTTSPSSSLPRRARCATGSWGSRSARTDI